MAVIQASKRQTCLNAILRTFCFRGIKLTLKLAITGQLIVDLCLTAKTQTRVGLIGVIAVSPGMDRFYFAVQIQFVAIFIINFRCMNGGYPSYHYS